MIRKAVFPIAGMGTRFLPATKASPKEMLPVVDKPLIQYAVEEAYAAGIRQMIFVTGRTKRAVEDHFDMAFELEVLLESSLKYDLLSLVRSIKPRDMECIYVRQPKALGLGDAIRHAEKLVENEPFAVILADDLMLGTPPILSQMIEKYIERETSIVAIQNILKTKTGNYGVIAGKEISDNLIEIQQVIEKPKPEQAPSALGIVGRYIFTPKIFDCLHQVECGVDGEIQLTDAISLLLKTEKVYAYRYSGTRYDCGSKLGFMQAAVDLAERHKDIGFDFSVWLETRKRVRA